MVKQMAAEMGPAVTPGQAMHTLIDALARHRQLKIRITGDPPEDIRAGIFVYTLLQHGICRPMAEA